MNKKIIFPILFSLFSLGLASCDEINASSGEKCEHVWDEGTITKEATEEEKGIKTFKCNVCEETKDEEIEKLQHTHKFESEWTTNTTHHWHEASCGHNAQISGKEEHVWDSGTVTKEATEVSTGVKTFKCTVCEEERKESIDKLICTHLAQNEYSTDKTHHWFACSICNEPLAKTEHSGGTATCTEKATCEVCNEKYGDLAPHNVDENVFFYNDQGHWNYCKYEGCSQKTDIVGHIYDNVKSEETFLASEASCTSAATYYKSCICGKAGSETFSVGEALGHTGGTATCEYQAQCDRCHKGYGEYAEHNYGTIISEVPATCEEDGMKAHYFCSGCKKYFDIIKQETTIEKLTISALQHQTEEESDGTYVWLECEREGCDYATEKELKESAE